MMVPTATIGDAARLTLLVAAFVASGCASAVTPFDATVDASRRGDDVLGVLDSADAPPAESGTPDSAADADAATCYPDCVERLLAACPAAMQCVQQTVSTSPIEAWNVCFPTGTRYESTYDPRTGEQHSVIRTPSGAICFRFDGNTLTDPGVSTFTDPSGMVIATFSARQNDPGDVTITCDGRQFHINVHAPICNGRFAGYTGPCTRGQCPP